MRTHYVDIPTEKWGVLLIYDFDKDDDEDLYAIMRSFNMSERNANKSLRILSTYNSGMAVSNMSLRMSAMFIGRATSMSQFWNSIVHETSHVASAIVDYYGEPCDGEAMAYLQGYIFQCIVEEVAEIEYKDF